MPQLEASRAHRKASGAFSLLHRARLGEWSPSPVAAIAPTPDGTVLAVARDSGDIELWDTEYWHCFKAKAHEAAFDEGAPGVVIFAGNSASWHAMIGLQRLPGREGAAIATLLWSFDRSNLQHRLFSAGLDCQLTEWDLDALQPKAVTDSLGGAVWAMAARPAGAGGGGDDAALVAVACDDGAARLFAACNAQAGLQYCRSLPRVEGRLLSLAWSADGGRLYTGSSSGSIHIWSWPSGVEVAHITAGSCGSAGDGSGTCVWALAALADGTLASGDSEGRTCFWDGGCGEPLAQLQEHLADVTCVAAAPDASRVFSAGVDVRVALFARRPAAADAAGAPAPWVYSDCKRPHSHDVRALAVVPASTAHGRQALLVSGGADAQLMVMPVATFTERPAARAGRCPQPPAVAMCRLAQAASDQLRHPDSCKLPHANGNAACSSSVPLVLLASHRHLDLWLVPQPADSPDVDRGGPSASTAADSDVASSQDASNAHGSIRSGFTGAEGTPVLPSALPQHLARIRKKGDDHILSTALHPKATGIAFSDAKSTTVLAARWSPGQPSPRVQLSRLIPRVDRRLPASHFVCFVPGPGLRLACVEADGVIRVYDVDADAVVLRYELTALADHYHRATRRSLVQRHARSAVKALVGPTAGVLASDDGQWLAARSATQVQLFNLETGRSHGRLQAAPDNSRVTCMGFSPSSSHIASCTVSHCVMLYDVESCAPTTWVKDYSAAAAMNLQTMPCCTSSIAFRPMQDALEVVLASPAGFCHINFKLPISSKRLKRRRTAHKPTEKDLSHPAGTNCRVLVQDQPCLGAGWLSPHSLLLLEHPWSRVLAQLPPPLYRHRYGT